MLGSQWGVARIRYPLRVTRYPLVALQLPGFSGEWRVVSSEDSLPVASYPLPACGFAITRVQWGVASGEWGGGVTGNAKRFGRRPIAQTFRFVNH